MFSKKVYTIDKTIPKTLSAHANTICELVYGLNII